MAARNGFKMLTAAIRAPFSKRFGLSQNANLIDSDFDNSYRQTWSNAADTNSIEALSVGSDNIIRLGQEGVSPAYQSQSFVIGANASIGQNNTFFIADKTYYIQAIKYSHATACSTAGTVTATVTRDTGTTAPGQGTSLMSNTFNAKATANTVVSGTLNGTLNLPTDAVLVLNAGDRLCLAFSNATLTSLACPVVTVFFSPGCTGELAVYAVHKNADITTQTFHVATRDMQVQAVYAIYGTAFAAAVTIDVTKDTSTNAPGAGTSILTAAMAGDGTINTLITPALAASAATLKMAAGDRLAVKFSAVTTGVDVCVVVVFQPLYRRKEVTFQLSLNAQQAVAQNFFIADRDYELIEAACTFATAAGGASVMTVTVDKGTTAPGAGNLTDASGFNLNSTANTVQYLAAGAMRLRYIYAGDRLGLNFSGAAQSSAKVAVTVSLLYR